jgi:hypothetical protein
MAQSKVVSRRRRQLFERRHSQPRLDVRHHGERGRGQEGERGMAEMVVESEEHFFFSAIFSPHYFLKNRFFDFF